MKKKEFNKSANSKTKKRIMAWIFLVLLACCFIIINYVKIFMSPNPSIKESPVENSSSEAIRIALNQIVENFNSSGQIQEYLDKNIEIKAIVNQYSIFISYADTNTTTTYEFFYSNLQLSTTIENTSENVEKFNKIYEILIRAVQKRIGNEENLKPMIENIINEVVEYDGIHEEKTEATIKYQIDITKKLKDESIKENEVE